MCGEKYEASNQRDGLIWAKFHSENTCPLLKERLRIINVGDRQLWINRDTPTRRIPSGWLQCAFCEVARPSFEQLAKHVQTARCFKQTKGDKYVSGDMLDPDEIDGMPEPDSGDGRPLFLKPHHLGNKKKGRLTLLGVSDETSDYSDVILRVELNKKEYAIGLKFYSEDYQACFKKYGKKKDAWKGQMEYSVRPYKGNSFVSVRPV
jgi:hypothetical protein